jgi:GNAT superfamily N-acetyltransferase
MDGRHPHHDTVAATLQTWYTSAAPAMGVQVERRPFGIYQRYGPNNGEVTLRDVAPADVPALLTDVRAYYGDASVGIYLDERQAEASVGPALVQAGCTKGTAETHLVHVGAAPAVRPVPGVVLEPLTAATLTEWATTKLQGFASSEAVPDPQRLAAEVAMRRADMADTGRFAFARAGGDPAAIVGLFDGDDRHIFLLATRVPFRHRGIARWLLAHTIAAAYADGCRSVLINCDPADTPIRLYRRLGFTDEVYWRQRYEPPTAATERRPATPQPGGAAGGERGTPSQ